MIYPENLLIARPTTTLPTIADWNGDGFPDILHLRVGPIPLLALGPFDVRKPITLRDEIKIPDPPSRMDIRQLKVADWDGDGLPDIVARRSRFRHQSHIFWYRNVGTKRSPQLADGVVLFEDRESKDGDIAGFCVADWNGDRKPDLIIARNKTQPLQEGERRPSAIGHICVHTQK